MSDFVRRRITVENTATWLQSIPDDARALAEAEIIQRAEEASRFAQGQLIFCWNPGALNLATWNEAPVDRSDRSNGFDSRVLGWDEYGRTRVATLYRDNPHNCDWCHTEDLIEPRGGLDWADRSEFKAGMRVAFVFDLPGFEGQPSFGSEVRDTLLLSPHIKPGDWFVAYPKPNGHRITRVLHESQMR